MTGAPCGEIEIFMVLKLSGFLRDILVSVEENTVVCLFCKGIKMVVEGKGEIVNWEFIHIV